MSVPPSFPAERDLDVLWTRDRTIGLASRFGVRGVSCPVGAGEPASEAVHSLDLAGYTRHKALEEADVRDGRLRKV
jgi:hypothetical protein